MIRLALLLVVSIQITNCYLPQHQFRDSRSYTRALPLHRFLSLYCNDLNDIDSNLKMVSEDEIVPNIDPTTELSNVKAVRYFINLTNGIEAVAPLLKQGVPMEHINVRTALNRVFDDLDLDFIRILILLSCTL